ncbi:MAG TPA: threonylcarbamoyl-AMP synthase [Candidatus Ruminococcus avistercoris]|nr:threonylcarbamoyl-AMP synthase [Candidatus Ruminococcus avistercoris]
MNTKIVKIDPAHPRMEDIREAGRIIREGGLVAFPTETVYGLGGNALDVTASQRIYAAKGRPSDNPLIVHIADMASLLPLVTEIPEAARKLASACWPGPLTMIFHKSSIVPLETTGGLDSVAVRFPSHPIACALIREGGGYVAAPSANTSGRPSPTMAEHVIEDLKGKIEMIVDGGSVGIGLESTIVDFTEKIPTILRPGYINEQMLRDILGEVRMDKGLIAEDSRIHPKAPGMKYRHYAPKGSLLIVEGQTDRVAAKIEEMAREKTAAGYTVGIIGTDESVGRYSSGIIKSIGTRSDEESIGRHLYSVLREFDDCGAAYIFSESFDTPKMGQAIMNRLLKAAGHQVIRV